MQAKCNNYAPDLREMCKTATMETAEDLQGCYTTGILNGGNVLAMARKQRPRSLNEYRLERYQSITEFIEFLGIATHTYYSAIAREGIRPSTMRRIAEKLGVHPSEITEFVQGTHDQPEPEGTRRK
jgi:hypothetical protein